MILDTAIAAPNKQRGMSYQEGKPTSKRWGFDQNEKGQDDPPVAAYFEKFAETNEFFGFGHPVRTDPLIAPPYSCLPPRRDQQRTSRSDHYQYGSNHHAVPHRTTVSAQHIVSRTACTPRPSSFFQPNCSNHASMIRMTPVLGSEAGDKLDGESGDSSILSPTPFHPAIGRPVSVVAFPGESSNKSATERRQLSIARTLLRRSLAEQDEDHQTRLIHSTDDPPPPWRAAIQGEMHSKKTSLGSGRGENNNDDWYPFYLPSLPQNSVASPFETAKSAAASSPKKSNSLNRIGSCVPAGSAQPAPPKPVKPLNSRNFFYSEMRDWLLRLDDEHLQALLRNRQDRHRPTNKVAPGIISSIRALLLESSGGEANVPLSREERKTWLLSSRQNKVQTTRRKHRRAHGKLSFNQMNMLINTEWKVLPQDDKEFYREVAQADKERYDRELKS